MIELPDFQRLKISQTSQAPTQRLLESLDHLLIVVPKSPARDLFRTLPVGKQLEKLLRRGETRSARQVATRLSNDRATGVTLAPVEAGASTFASLTWARKLLGECLRDHPQSLGLFVTGLADEDRQRVAAALLAAAAAASFKLPAFKTRSEAEPRTPALKSVKIFGSKPRLNADRILAEALGNNIARYFTVMPPSELTAKNYRLAIEKLAKRYGLSYEFFDEAALDKRGAGAFLAVSRGNADRDAGIIRLRHGPARKSPDLALVGKGILFDTGGTNLKPFKGMLDMHGDMQGSAVALGCIIALASLDAPYSVEAWLAVTENRLSATSYKSQDIVRAMNGTTIQVIHTDAEGRMVLADTLTLAARNRPKLIIDYATLTGSCVAALTDRYSGVLSNRESADQILIAAGKRSGERVWPFPMDPDFDEALRSDVADIKQCAADGYGDHILAARFLSRFVPESIPWIHVDLSSGQRKGGLAHVPSEVTGFGVRLTLALLAEPADGPAGLAKQLSK